MSEYQFERVAEAFGRKSTVYDAFGRDHIHLTRMRNKVYGHIQAVRPAGGKLLELNAGTGLDALQLVRRGYQIHATDLSPGMITQIETKVAQHNLQNRLTVQQLSFTDLSQVADGPFDGVYSNFGGLNCIDDLRQVTGHLPRLLKPNGTVTWVIMPRFCPWELAHIWKDWRVALRRFRPNGIVANVEGVQFKTTYFSVREVEQAFGNRFKRQRLEGLSIFSPSADNKTVAVNYPNLYQRLIALDDRICFTRPFCGWGDFFILTMRWLGKV